MLTKILIILTIGVAAVAPAVASDVSGEAAPNRQEARLDSTSGLQDYVAFALANNPLLRSYEDRYRAAREVPAQVGALPDPMLSASVYASNPETRVGAQHGGLMLSQTFPFFGKRALKRDIARKDADVWGQTYEAQALDLIRDVKRTYYDYYRIERVIATTQSEKDVIRQMQNVAQVKYASGIVSQQDVLKAQLALSNLDDRLTSLRRDLVTVTARMNELLNRDPGAPLAPPHVEKPRLEPKSADALYEIALAKRPELGATDLAIESAEKSKRLARRDYFPDLTLAASYMVVDERPGAAVEDNGKDILLFTASVNLPIWYRKLRASVRESDARIAMERNHRQGLRTKIRSDIEDALSRVRSAAELVVLYEKVIIPQAEQTFRASEAGYQTGRVDFLNYLDSQRMLLTLRQTYFGLVADLGKQTADLERTVGVGIEDINL